MTDPTETAQAGATPMPIDTTELRRIVAAMTPGEWFSQECWPGHWSLEVRGDKRVFDCNDECSTATSLTATVKELLTKQRDSVMAKKISITGKPARQIEVTGKPYRRIEPEEFARALGAEAVNDSHAPNLDPLSLAVLGSANMADGVGIAYLRNNALALADEIDRLQAELSRVTAERDAARQVTADDCEDEQDIRELARPYLGNQVDGDSYAVPPIVDVVRWALDAAWNAAIERCVKAIEFLLDEHCATEQQAVGLRNAIASCRALARPETP